MKSAILIIYVFFLFQDNYPPVFTRYDSEIKAILIFASDNQSKLYEQSINLLIKDPLGIDKRNIKIFEVFVEGGIGPGGEPFSSEEVISIRKYFNIESSAFNILLAQQNFKEIFRSDKPVSVDDIFQKFDVTN
jgi:hypothetical protein